MPVELQNYTVVSSVLKLPTGLTWDFRDVTLARVAERADLGGNC